MQRREPCGAELSILLLRVLQDNSDTLLSIRAVGIGLVASLARPGGNATGNSLMAPDLSAKRLDILHTLAPGISRFAILWDSSNPGMAERVPETKIAADQSRVTTTAALRR